MNVRRDTATASRFNLPIVGALILFVVELLLIGVLFKHGIDFECRANWPKAACKTASGSMVSIYGVVAALALFALLFRAPMATLLQDAGTRMAPLAINAFGLIVALMPLTFLREGSGSTALPLTLLCWSVGMAAMIAGLALFLAPFQRWVSFYKDNAWQLVPLVIGGACAPLLATLIRPIWQLDAIAGTTFSIVTEVIHWLGYQVEVFTEHRIIGANGFYIDIAPVCSGIEGIALVTIFVTLYLYLFRSDLRFPRVLLLYPIGIAVSAALNVLRIVILLVIGLEGNPELAVGGFHSHAGWLMFTVVALGIIAVSNTVTWFRKDADTSAVIAKSVGEVQPFFQDPIVARILPFAVFMFSAMLAQAFSQSPGVIYPARALLMAGVLLAFLPVYRALEWRLDPIAIGVGAAIGLMWVLIPVADTGAAAPYGALTGGLLVAWFCARGLGTIVLVPIIEELFFRDYLESRLRRDNSIMWTVIAAIITAGLFALLHDRWAEAFVAGLAFSFVMWRSGRVVDAIVAHGVANAIVFGVALTTGQMHII